MARLKRDGGDISGEAVIRYVFHAMLMRDIWRQRAMRVRSGVSLLPSMPLPSFAPARSFKNMFVTAQRLFALREGQEVEG